MSKTFLLFLISFVLLQATELEVFSGCVDSNGSVIHAKDDVNVIYENMMVSAQKMIYDKNKSTIDFSGNIRINKASDYFLFGETLHVNTKEKTNYFQPLFLHEKKNNLWFSAEKALSKEGVYDLHDAIVSSCNPMDPEWKISYSSGTYDSADKWVGLYNIVLYAGDIPFFYLPYFAFSTDTTRRSGFLIPTIGVSATEGVIIEQPFYIAVSDQVDIELRFQTRSERGNGLFTDIRFVDGLESEGNIKLGYFQETNEDNETFGWTNKEHFGIDIDYDRTHVIDDWIGSGVTDKFFVDIKLYNDIDYVNLQAKKNVITDTSTVLTSRLNYMLTGESHYLGVYGKYFFDTTAETTVETLQELPKFQYHKYVDTLGLDNLSYSFDYTTTARSRVRYPNAYENVMTVPIVYATSFFGDYINVSLTEDITLSNINFHQTDGNKSFERGNYASSSQTLAINTDIMKKYENTTHAIRFGASYIFPGYEDKSGFYENKEGQFSDQNCTVGELCEFVQGSIDPVGKSVNIELTQYLFDKSGKEWLYHKLSQPISVEDNTSYGTLENEIRIKLTDNVTLYNNLFYDAQTDEFDKVSSSLSYNGNGVNGSLTHLFQNEPEIGKESDYYTFKLEYQTEGHYTYTTGYAYDDLLKTSRNIVAGIEMKKRCWSYAVQFSERIIPTSSASLIEQYVSLRINLLPITGIGYQHQLSIKSE